MFDTTPQRRLDVRGVTLAWGEWGPPGAPTIVLCHGYTGSSHDFALHIEPLAERWHVVVVDHRGHGKSGHAAALAAYSIEQITNDLLVLLDAVTQAPVTLLGHSLGGRVALGATLARPDHVNSLVLMDTSAWSFASEDDEVRALVSDVFATIDPTVGLPAFDYRRPEDDLIDAATSRAWRERKAELSAEVDGYAVKALGIELFVDGVVSLRPRLDEITCPCTVIVGGLDEPYRSQSNELAAALGAELVVIEGAYHSPQLTHQALWRNAVEGHLTAAWSDRASPSRVRGRG